MPVLYFASEDNHNIVTNAHVFNGCFRVLKKRVFMYLNSKSRYVLRRQDTSKSLTRRIKLWASRTVFDGERRATSLSSCVKAPRQILRRIIFSGATFLLRRISSAIYEIGLLSWTPFTVIHPPTISKQTSKYIFLILGGF